VRHLILGIGGFTELQKYGRWTVDPRDYVARVHRYRDEIGGLCWAAPQDWMFTHPYNTCRTSSLTRTVDVRIGGCDVRVWPAERGQVDGVVLQLQAGLGADR